MGKNKINYDDEAVLEKVVLISEKDVRYLLKIAKSEELSDEEKAMALFEYCDYDTFMFNFEEYRYIGNSLYMKLIDLKKYYVKYQRAGYFENCDNNYKCSKEELNKRIAELKVVSNILLTDGNEYSKIEFLLTMFRNSDEFKRKYALIVKNGKEDSSLDSIRFELDHFDLLYELFKKYEKENVVRDIKNIWILEKYNKNYEYAKFVISSYINSDESINEKEFLQDLGIDKDVFEYCEHTIDLLDHDLYEQFLDKKNTNQKKRIVDNAKITKDLIIGIKTGILPDETPFSTLEFLKRMPFKNNDDPVRTLHDFVKKVYPKQLSIMTGYLHQNNLYSLIKPIDSKGIKECKTIIHGVEITDEMNQAIVDYLRVNHLPLFQASYLIAREKLLNGEFTIESVKQKKLELKEELEPKVKLLIPHTNKFHK